MSIISDHVPPAPPAREGCEGRTATERGHRAAYAVVGAVMAAVWALGGDTPAWEHALRLLLLILGVSVAVRLVRRRLARTGRVPVSGRLFFGLLAAKMLLVAVALLVDWIMRPLVLRPEPGHRRVPVRLRRGGRPRAARPAVAGLRLLRHAAVRRCTPR